MEWRIKDSRPPEKIIHPSTMAALTGIRTLHMQGLNPSNILDLGCGSGLLTLQALALWPHARAVAADVSGQAVADCGENMAGDARVQVVRSDGYRNDIIRQNAPYALILANLLAEVLAALSGDAARHLAPGGVMVLSGILAWQQQPVVEAHRAAGLEFLAEIPFGHWRALMMAKPS